jgi:ABC-type glycerol-3-phosphate transport system substrate-binding protein
MSNSHKVSRRRFLQRSAALGAAVGLATLAGCAAPAAPQAGTGTGASAPAAATTEVLFWKSPHSDKEADLWKPLLDKFMDANPGITVEHQVIPWGSVDEQYTAAFAAGEPPDVFYLPDEWYPKYVNQGQVADITEHISGWQDQYTTAGWAGVTYKGGTWGAPFLGVAQGWILNMNLFKEKGVSIPTNWEEFRAAAAELTDAGAGIYGLAPFVLGWGSWIIYVPLLATGGAKVLSDDLRSVAFNTEGGIAAFKALYEDIGWTDKSTTPLGFSEDQNNQLSLQGNVGMQWQETHRIKAVWREQAPDLELATVPMLQVTDNGIPASWANIGFMFIAEQAKDNAGAFALLDYLSTDEMQVEYVQKGVDLLPLKKGIAPLPDADPIVAEIVSWLDNGWGVGTQISVRWREATEALKQEAEAIMSGLKTTEQALADAEATITPILDGE